MLFRSKDDFQSVLIEKPMKFSNCLGRKLFVFLYVALIFYCATVWTQFSAFGKNSPPATISSETTSETENEKTTEFKLEDLVSQQDHFAFDYDLETARYGDSIERILIQYFAEIESPPPENLHLSI
ncbi:hypothetical protein [Leptospira santarosai]|uniref:hypothetical protein n=1 Tax=Leptospira santarosai TaxID=28183 RepID=UPI0024AEB974|nr:hypothetical protein [Leptospira santarosai]MDI7223959.1 hypothetical protein [Leptospira santarosai]MDI7228237.1 hypothetical protein [Leptospira santarosai]